jgi:SulP family sulfate permease
MTSIFKPKLFSLIKQGIPRSQLWADITAGMVVGVVALPLAIAFAVASGVSPEKGLITAVIAGLIISLLGGSRVQIGGPTGAFIVIVYGIVEKHGVNGLVISTLMAGLILIAFGLLRLGVLLKFIPHPLIVGFTSGVALVIFSTQIHAALGLQLDLVPSEFIEKWCAYGHALPTWNPQALIITLLTVIVTVYAPRIHRAIPGSFFAIILMTVLTQLLGLDVTTIETFFGEIPRHMSVVMPHFEIADLGQYIPAALTIAMLGAIESLLSAVVADGMISGNHRSNTELIAQGIANVVTPFFGGIPATGAIARTATNVRNGGRTPVAGIVHALTLLLIVSFFGQWAKLIPMSCLAGVLIVVSYHMSEWRTFISILKYSWFDAAVLLTTFFLTVLVDLTIAIEVGVMMSAMLFMKRMADVGSEDILEETDTDLLEDYSSLPPSITHYEISGPLFFASAKQYAEVIKSTGIKARVIIIRMRHVPFIDTTGLKNLKDSVKFLLDSGTIVLLSGVNPRVKADLKKSGIVELLGSSGILDAFNDAVAQAKRILPDLRA